jgi:hypothetical protein
MAWATTRTIYNTVGDDFTVIIGSGGKPGAAIGTTRGLAYREDASDAATVVYGTIDSGATWSVLSEAASAAVAASGTGVVATSEALSVKTLTLTLTAVAFAMVDEAGVVAYSGLKIADMPEGAISILGAVASIALTKSSAGVIDTWDGDFALGTATASNNATLSATEADIIPSTATPQAVAGAANAFGQSTGTECPAYFDGTATAKDVYLNFLVDDADHDVTSTPCNLIATGTVKITYVNLGDY